MAHIRYEVLSLILRGENLVFTMILPVLFLVFFARVDVLPDVGRPVVDHIMPIIVTVAVMASTLLGLSISTGFERKFLVLKRLGITPLGRGGLLLGKIGAVLVVETLQLAVLGLVAGLLGWRPLPSELALGLAFVIAGSAAFGGLAMLLAGTLRAEGTLALSNVIYVVLILFGGVAVPLSSLPGPVASVGQLLPSAALATGLSTALWGDGLHGGALLLLGVWSLLWIGLAARTFRWE
jgi:ABC-2 type transport system permease protein